MRRRTTGGEKRVSRSVSIGKRKFENSKRMSPPDQRNPGQNEQSEGKKSTKNSCANLMRRKTPSTLRFFVGRKDGEKGAWRADFTNGGGIAIETHKAGRQKEDR